MQLQTQLLRKTLRSRRRQLSIFTQRRSAFQVLSKIQSHSKFKSAQKIGIYLDAFGEVQTHILIMHCFSKHKVVYLPKVSRLDSTLKWVPISKHQYLNKRFTKHKLGMYEPMHTLGQNVKQLDVLLMPLVACDHHGTRMGMGGGFYDRTLKHASNQPYRIGLAHDFQLIFDPLKRQPWDQPLDELITPKKRLKFKRRILINPKSN